MTAFLIDHDFPECIGCGACAALDPDVWLMDGDKAHVANATKVDKENGTHEQLELPDEEAFNKQKEIAEACPVNCIHMLKDGEQVI